MLLRTAKLIFLRPLYSLAEFTTDKTGIRDTTDLIDKYRKGVFGALPEPDLFQSLMEVRSNG